MPENREMLRQSLLADLTVLHGNLEKTWTIALSLPVGKTRTDLETHPSKLCAIGAEHAEDFDGNDLASL